MQKMIDTTVLIFDLPIFSKNKSDLLDLMHLGVNRGKSLLKVATPNPEQIIQAQQNPQFLGHLQQFDLLLPDGQGLVWASQLLAGRGVQAPLQTRIAGREVVADLLQFAQTHNMKVLVIGGRGYEGQIMSHAKIVPVSAIETKDDRYPIYWTYGYENIESETSEEEQQLTDTIKQLKPDIVFVAFGAPFQEAWIINHQQLLEQANVKLAMVVGGSFDYLLGKVPQVPWLVEKLGFEWLFRLVAQPWRWKRQLRLLSFVYLVFKQALTSSDKN
jgi:N-acetylglucosaminyldiphosphoundecaprenol N-acetyl-beta-D-mannosaminyltransferase